MTFFANNEEEPSKDFISVSVIVAAYNVEQYLDKCIASLMRQVLKNIEIIIVNDGSSDGTADICKLWEEKDSRVKVITQDNQGLSAARNAGLKIAKGEYIGFVDGDDYVMNSMYADLYSQAISINADIVSCRFIDCYGGVPEEVIQGENTAVTAKEAIRFLLQNTGEFTGHMCNKIFKRSLICQMGFPVGKIYEDSHVIVNLLVNSNVVGIVNKGEYFYCHRETSIVESEFSEKDYSLLEAWKKNRKIISDNFPDLREENDYWYYWICFYLLDKMVVFPEKNKDNIKDMTHFLRSNKKAIISNKYFKMTRKVAFLVLCFSVKGYSILSKMNSRRVK